MTGTGSPVSRSRPVRAGGDDPAADAAPGLLARPTWELIPLKNAREQAASLPPRSTVSVTASPAKGLDATLDLAIELEQAGHRAVPHLSARMVRDEQHLQRLLGRMRDAGIDRTFVVGGDEEVPGAFEDALALLRAMADLDGLPREIGIGCYPQGHPFIPDARLLEALAAKVPFATYMTSQLCFDPRAISSWLAARRADGVDLPLRIGIPGVAEIPKLLTISARIGVRDASRFVLKNRRFVGELLRSGGIYRPTRLVEDLGPLAGDAAAAVIGVHVYTFNNVAPTVDWYRQTAGADSAAGDSAAGDSVARDSAARDSAAGGHRA